MKSNVEVIREVLEQVVNQKKVDRWDDYFSENYIARGASFMGLGFFRDTSGNTHTVDFIIPNGPAEGVMERGDELVWIEDEKQRWDTFDDISEGLRLFAGSRLKAGVKRGDQALEIEITRGLIQGYNTSNEQAKSEMEHFMTTQIPDLSVEVKMTLADGDKVVCLMEYRGTHAEYGREANWREIWIARLSEGKIVESWPLPDVDAYCRQLGFRVIAPGENG